MKVLETSLLATSVTVTVTVYVPAVVAVPEIPVVGLICRPGGSPVAVQ